MRRLQQSVVCLLLAGFSAGASFALPPQDRTWPAGGRQLESPAPTDFLAALGNLLTRVWGRIGCSIDPAGGCQPATQGDIGCEIDPAGRCQPATQGDIGCQIDPYGGCPATTQADIGCKIDPYGGCAPSR